MHMRVFTPHFRLFHRLLLVLLIALAGGLVAAGCSNGDAELRPVTFMAGFRPQANLPFVAAYVAADQGYFADEGLEVEIQHSSGQDEHVKLLLDRSIDFTTGTAAQALVRRGDGLPLTAVALFGQRGDQGYVARADSGIASPADFKGHTVGFKAGVVPAELTAMLNNFGLTTDDIKLVGVGFDSRIFIERQVDVYPVFLNNEPDSIRRAGVEINVIDPAEYGVPTLGLTYLVHQDTLDQDRDLVERFLRATLRAVHWIEGHEDEAVQVVLKYAPDADAEHQRFLLETDLAAAQRADGIGRGTLERWQELERLLRRHEVLTVDVDPATAFDGSIVDALYEDGEIE